MGKPDIDGIVPAAIVIGELERHAAGDIELLGDDIHAAEVVDVDVDVLTARRRQIGRRTEITHDRQIDGNSEIGRQAEIRWHAEIGRQAEIRWHAEIRWPTGSRG